MPGGALTGPLKVNHTLIWFLVTPINPHTMHADIYPSKLLQCWEGYLRVNVNVLSRSHWHIFSLFRPSEAADTAPLYCCNPLNTPLTHNEDIPDPSGRRPCLCDGGAAAEGCYRKSPERISRHEEVSAVARSAVASCAVQEKQQGETADVHLLGLPCRSWSLSAASASLLLRSFVSACPPRTNDLRPNPVCCFLLVCGAFFPVAQENRRWGWMGVLCSLSPPLSLSLSGFRVHDSN